MSKFQQLVDLNKTDQKSTHEYVEKITLFASLIKQRLTDYLECGPGSVRFLTKDNQVSPPHGNATIDLEGYFNFRILIDLKQEAFNINECGQDFFKKGLIPLSGIILNIGILIHEGTYNVKAPCIQLEQVTTCCFTLRLEDSNHWETFVASCFDSMKHIASRDLSTRMKALIASDSDESNEGHKDDRISPYLPF
jgi:hypothetical protein